MTVKRSSREEDHDEEVVEASSSSAMANCLMLLSNYMDKSTKALIPSLDRVFTCKTCNKEFLSFQALGGHRASHKRLRLMVAADPHQDGRIDHHHSTTAKPKKHHECSICGLDFELGQALGGHMRRHRRSKDRTAAAAAASSSQTQSDNNSIVSVETPSAKTDSNTHNTVFLPDLNLTPYENVLKFGRFDYAI